MPHSKLHKLVPVRVSIDPATHASHRRNTSDMVEHGGNFGIDFTKRRAFGVVETQGKYNKIDMTRGVLDWHSHPRKCADDDTCALGIPSPDDIHNVVLGHIYGNLGHLVYAKEGTYFIQLDPVRTHLVSCNFPVLEKYLGDLRRVSDDLHEMFLKRRFPYHKYIKNWCTLMTKCGITVKFFKGNTIPRFTVFIEPEDAKDLTTYRRINVPTNIKADKKRLKFCGPTTALP